MLRRVAGIIRDQCRQNDLPVRYGGDEFLLVLAGADLALGARVLGRLKETVDAWPWAREAPGLKVTLSIGIATRPRGGTDRLDDRGRRRGAVPREGRGPQPHRDEGLGGLGEHVAQASRSSGTSSELADRGAQAIATTRRCAAARSAARTRIDAASRCA